MKLWFIITPKGKPAQSRLAGLAFAANTRKACIKHWCCWGESYGVKFWADWQRLGYRCERREVGE